VNLLIRIRRGRPLCRRQQIMIADASPSLPRGPVRRHRTRQRQRRESARELMLPETVTVTSSARRYGVDRCTAYDDLTVLGVALPDSARQRARRPRTITRRTL
jgi:hypothetical protein